MLRSTNLRKPCKIHLKSTFSKLFRYKAIFGIVEIFWVCPISFLDTLFFYFIRTRPRKSVVICKTFSKFAVSQGVMPSALHIDESVFAFILDTKSDSFNEKRIRQHSFLV